MLSHHDDTLNKPSDFSPRKKRIHNILKAKMRIITVATLVISLTGYLGTLSRHLDVTSHFKMQYLTVSIYCFIVLLLLRNRRWAIAGLLCVVINGGAVLPWYVGSSQVQPHPNAARLKLLLSNVLISNQSYTKLIELVRSEKPDLLVLQEVDDRWMQELRPLRKLFTHSMIITRNDGFGIAVLSRNPLLRARQVSLGGIDTPNIVAEINIAGNTAAIIATHPLPPQSDLYFHQRNLQLSAIAPLVQRLSMPVIVVGDFNTTMWSPFYSKLIKETGLVNARKGHGVLPTWPTNLPLLKIPLDHCLISSGINAVGIRTGSNVGSDHLPLIVDLSFNNKT